MSLEAPVDDDARLRVPPHSIEAEQSVLGALMLDNSAFAAVRDDLSADDFYRHEHRAIYAAATAMLKAKQPVDEITLFERLREEGGAEAIGGLKYLTALAQVVPSALSIARYAELVRERAVFRRLVAMSDEIASQAFNPQGRSVGQILDEAKVALTRIDESHGQASRRLPLLDLAELREASAQLRWVVKNMVPTESIGMLFGASGTFKSFVALDAALHVAHGLPWLGRRTAQGPVIYIAAEGGTGLWKRVVAWHRSRRLQWKDAPFYVVPSAVDLQADAWRVVEAAQAVGVQPALVIVDTLSQTYAGEENSANEMAAYLREIGLRFRQLWQCAVMLVHHTGHNATERPRGSSAIRANLDFMFGVFRDEKEMLATLTCVKQKEQDAFADATFQLIPQDLGEDEDGDRITSLVARHLSSVEEVRQAMSAESTAGRGGNNRLLLSLVQNGMREQELRKAFFEDCGIDDTDSRRRAYNRSKDWARRTGFIEVAQGTVISLKAGRE